MTDRIKAAALSFFVIALITGLKFILYYMSGSVAVLSEAWHSFSDIATTLLVLIAIIRQQHKTTLTPSDTTSPSTDAKELSDRNPIFGWFSRVDTELKTAALISMVLLTVSILILWRAVFSVPVSIEMPLVTGIIFICLSFGSFFLYRFQDTMGREEDSAALQADSLHNRADMAISLLTGTSLILYHFGIDIDRWVSVYIALFIFSFSVEMLANAVVSMGRGSSGLTADLRFNEICRAAFRSGTYSRIMDTVIRYFPLSEKRQALAQKFPVYFKSLRRWVVFGAVVVLVLSGLRSMFYAVGVDEEALLLRFGKVVQTDRAVPSGLHWKMPWPVDRIHRFQTHRINAMAVGNTADTRTPMIWHVDHGDTTTYISGDNNLFLPYLIVHYRIKNPREYYMQYRNGAADKLLEYLANHILTHILATRRYYDIALFDRQGWTTEAERELQRLLDEMRAGIEVVSFCLRDLHPPKDIAASYENVVAAYQNREQSLNEAEQYYNTKLPETRAAAHKTVTDAGSMAEARVKLAEGEAENYRMRLSGFRKSGEAGKALLSHRAARKSLKNRKLFLVDPESGIDTRLLYFENYIKKENTR